MRAHYRNGVSATMNRIICRGVTAIFAQPRFCALSVRVKWRRRSSKTPRKRVVSGYLTGLIMRRRKNEGCFLTQRGLFLNCLILSLTVMP